MSITKRLSPSLMTFVLASSLLLCHAGRSADDQPKPAAFDPATESVLIAKSTAKPKPLRILVFGAHPADVFDQSGGTMAHHVERGDWVGCVVVTTGARVHDKVLSNKLAESKVLPGEEEINRLLIERAKVKEAEVIKACSILGVRSEDVYFLNNVSQPMLVNEAMVAEVARVIRKLKPDVILTHYPYEDGAMNAHAITGQLVVHALEVAAGVDPEDRNTPHKVTQVFFFGIGAAKVRGDLWSSQGGFFNDIFVDITDVAVRKVAALDCLVSQNYAGAYAHKRIEATDGSFGSKGGVPYAEGFISLYSTTQYYLPVSEINRAHTNTTDSYSIKRKGYRVDPPFPEGLEDQ